MDNKEFEEIVSERCKKILTILNNKGKEYSRNNNPFHNFEVGAKISNKNSLEVLDGFLLKHIISYKDILEGIKIGKIPTVELVEEKFGDIINYFILQEAQIKKIIKKYE